MSRRVPRCVRPALLALLLLATTASDGAAGVLVALGQWQARGGRLVLVVPLADALTPKQRSIIGGGFTTVSLLTLKLPRPGQEEDDDDQTQPFAVIRCTVKFDAWEETYDVASLDESAKAFLVKGFNEYGEMCLKATVRQPDVLARLAPAGGILLADLVVKQTSVEEAARIKEWLVQQQSGVMQSLFSHMLGELTLNQTLKVRVSVPPRPEGLPPASGPSPAGVAPPLAPHGGKG